MGSVFVIEIAILGSVFGRPNRHLQVAFGESLVECTETGRQVLGDPRARDLLLRALPLQAEEAEMRGSRWLQVLVMVGLIPAVSLAGNVVEFTDGRYMEVERFEVNETVVHLALAGGAVLVVPQSQIDQISERDRVLFKNPQPEPAAASSRATATANNAWPRQKIWKATHLWPL